MTKQIRNFFRSTQSEGYMEWLNTVAFLLYLAALILGLVAFFFNDAVSTIDLRYTPLISAMAGFGVNLFKLTIDNKRITENQSIVNRNLQNMLKRGQVIYDHILFTENLNDPNVNKNPHLGAFLKAGEEYAYKHLKNLTSDYKRLSSGQSIEIKDIPITAEFLSNIVYSLDPIQQSCVWMGTSRITNPIGWDDNNDPLFRFAESIRDRSMKSDDDLKKLHVHRIYSINNNESENAINSKIENLYRKHLIKELKNNIKIKILYTPVEPIDFSLVFIPQSTQYDMKDFKLINPGYSLDEIHVRGWKIICGIHWEVRRNYFVEGAKVYPEGDVWVKNQYLKFRRFWSDGVEVNQDKLPVYKKM